jgi:sporulation protein YlmC with PRC-barrel domain
VDASDGHIGRVDEFLVNPSDNHVTHLVVREGHLWAQKDVLIPISQIDRIGENVVFLKLDKQSAKELLPDPVR